MALVLPVMLFILIASVYLVRSYEVQILWHQAGKNAIEGAKLAVNIAGMQDLSKVQGKLLEKLPEKFQEPVRNYLVGRVSEMLLLEVQKQWFNRFVGERGYFYRLLEVDQAHIKGQFSDHRLIYETNYKVKLGPISKLRSDRWTLPLWNLKDLSKIDVGQDGKEKAQDNIWNEHNFSRGAYFRQKYGGNLPATFPILSGFSSGEALVIKSIDLTAPTYANDEALALAVSRETSRLLKYKGTGGQWGSQGISIEASDIRSRKIKWIIPENTPADRKALLEQFLSGSGVLFEIHEDLPSSRYEKKEKPGK